MFTAKLKQLAGQSAGGTVVLRIAVVGVNLVVMLGLAAVLGLETYGALVVVWAAALVAGTAVSLGAPVSLLHLLNDGQGMHAGDLLRCILVYPAVVALTAFPIVLALWPGLPWAVILAAGFCVNLLGCLASVMRALGSVQASMALRDAGPQLALGVAGVMLSRAEAGLIILTSGAVMAVLALCAAIWCARHAGLDRLLSSRRTAGWSLAQWGNAVVGMAVTQIDLILGGAVISAEQLGLYALLRRVANLTALPVTVATWVSAPAVSAAHGAGDLRRLQRASAAGSQIALLPGLALFALGMLALPALPYVVPQSFGMAPGVILAILLVAALGQVVFASSFTVATLCGAAMLAMGARLLMGVIYLLWFAWWGPDLTATANALGYALALTLGGAVLWWVIRRRLGVDTGASVLWRRKGGQWKTS